jgi:plasmid stabilization system protein ParE
LAYRVEISDTALIDAEEYVQFIRARNEPVAAERWFRGLISAIFSLEELPLRCPLIPEAAEFPVDLRHLIFHSHRIIFKVDEHLMLVTVVRVYHGARERIHPDDISQ